MQNEKLSVVQGHIDISALYREEYSRLKVRAASLVPLYFFPAKASNFTEIGNCANERR